MIINWHRYLLSNLNLNHQFINCLPTIYMYICISFHSILRQCFHITIITKKGVKSKKNIWNEILPRFISDNDIMPFIETITILLHCIAWYYYSIFKWFPLFPKLLDENVSLTCLSVLHNIQLIPSKRKEAIELMAFLKYGRI